MRVRSAAMLLVIGGVGACSAPPTPSAATGFDAPTASRVDTPEDLLARARALFAADRFDHAAAVAETLLERFPDDAKTETVLFLAAESRYQAGDFERALTLFQTLLERFPYTRAHAVLAERFFVIGESMCVAPPERLGGLVVDRRSGIDALSRLVVHYPEDPRADDAWMRLGAAHLADGAYDLSAEAYLRLLRRYPESPLREDAAWRLVQARLRKWKGPEYDPAPLDAVTREIERYLSEFGEGGRHVEEAISLRGELTRDRERHGEAVDRFYRSWDR